MSTAPRLDRPATYADLEALPANVRGEIIDGTLYAFPRPRGFHSSLESSVVTDVHGAFHRRGGGPGGWWILAEPSIQLPRSAEVSPDVAGWRRERLPKLPRRGPITVVPDWVCEVLSPRTRRYDLTVKRPFYAQIGVAHAWYVDPPARVLTVSRLEVGKWVEIGVYGADAKVRAEPFDAIEIELGAWWDGLDLDEDDEEEDEPA